MLEAAKPWRFLRQTRSRPLSLGSACRSSLMGTPFPCPDHSLAWLYKGFSSCLRTSHPNPRGKPNWKPQKAITLKALCSESSTCLAAPAPAHRAVPLGHGHTERLHTWNNKTASPGSREGGAGSSHKCCSPFLKPSASIPPGTQTRCRERGC